MQAQSQTERLEEGLNETGPEEQAIIPTPGFWTGSRCLDSITSLWLERRILRTRIELCDFKPRVDNPRPRR